MTQGKVVRLNAQLVKDLEQMRENQIVEILARKNYVLTEFIKINKSGVPVAIRHLDQELEHVKNQSLSDLIQLAVFSYLNDQD